MGAFFCFGVVVTAADRAAATLRRRGDEPLRPPVAGTSPFRGGFVERAAKRLPPQRKLSAARLTEDKPLKLSFIQSAFSNVSSPHSLASFRRRRRIFLGANGGRTTFPLQQCTSKQNGYLQRKLFGQDSTQSLP